MRISELSERTGVPVHTLKYYLREGVLMPGTATGRTRADYDERHVERVGLVRALVEHAHVPVASVRTIIGAIEGPAPRRHDLLAVAHAALPASAATTEVLPDVLDVLRSLGWAVRPDAPELGDLSDAVAAARRAGVALAPESLRRYADAMRGVADVDLDLALGADSAEEALHLVVVGTVLVDRVLVALRRIAQEAVGVERSVRDS